MYSAGTLETESKGNRSGLTLKCFFVLTMYYLHKSAACLAAYPEKGLSLCSGALMGTLVVAHSVGTVSTSDLAVARLYRQGPGSKSESFSVGRRL